MDIVQHGRVFEIAHYDSLSHIHAHKGDVAFLHRHQQQQQHGRLETDYDFANAEGWRYNGHRWVRYRARNSRDFGFIPIICFVLIVALLGSIPAIVSFAESNRSGNACPPLVLPNETTTTTAPTTTPAAVSCLDIEPPCDGNAWIVSFSGAVRSVALATGVVTFRGTPVASARDLAFDYDGTLWIMQSGQLARLNIANPLSITLNNTVPFVPPNVAANGLVFDCLNRAYSGADPSQNGVLFQINANTGFNFALISGLPTSPGDVAVTFMGRNIYYASPNQLFRVNLDTLTSTFLGALPVTLLGLDSCNGVLYGLTSTANIYIINITGFPLTASLLWSTVAPSSTSGLTFKRP